MSTEDSNKDRGEADSMWLQKSITLPDPLPNCSGSTPPTKNNSPANPTGVEMDLTRSTADAASILASVQKPSMRYSTRMSVSNAAFSMHEMDDLRTKYSQAKRELLKVSDVQKDLDFARFELNRTQEELKMVQSTQRSLRDEVGEAEARADREAKARTALELRMHDEMGLKDKEIGFLKQQIDELRQDNSKRLNDITEQQEVEYQERIQMLRDDLLQATNDVEGLNAKLADAETEKGALEEQLNAVKAERDAARSSTVDLHKKMESVLDQCKDLEKRHQDFVVQFEEDHEKQLQSQLTLNDERVKQLTASKDASITELREEIRGQKDRIRELGDELAVLRHRRDQQEDELKQLITDHAKELRNAAEEHRLALCERELMMDSAVREAKGSKVSLEEENLLLRRQATKAVEELNTVAAALVQREKQVAEMESTVRTVKESCAKYSRENEIIAHQAEVEREAADEAALRIQRLIEQKEELEMEFSKDLREAKDRIRSLEESLMLARREISDSNKERLQSDEGERVVVKDLRAQVEAISTERNQLRQRCSTLEAAQREAESFKSKYSMEKQKAETLNVELHAAIGRCSTLERKLDGEARRQITSANNSRERSNSAQPKLRTISSANVLPRAAVVGGKRARTEDARVFAISGFDGNDLLSSIKKMPNVAIAECLSNLPVPSNLTHLITNGQLTIKLLTALVRGCWVLPESYVMDSLQERTWLPENNYGFQHEQPPLLKKHIAFSDAFMESKHYSTSTLLLKEGGAIISSMEEADIILCSGNEVDQLDGTGYTWEKMVDLIYPVKI